MSKSENSEPRYGCFTVRIDCPHCAQPLPLNGLQQEATCGYCVRDVTVAHVWPNLLKHFEDSYFELPDGELLTHQKNYNGVHVVYQFGKKEPSCEKCQAAYPVDTLSVGRNENFSCVNCGDPASTYPAPPWVSLHIGTLKQAYSVDPRAIGQPAGETYETNESVRPIALSCPQCAGSLMATFDSTRIIACQYCKTEVYLPDEIWRRLHPVKIIQPFYIRFEGLTEKQKSLARSKKENEERLNREAVEQARARVSEEQSRATQAQEKARFIRAAVRRAWITVALAWTVFAGAGALYIFDCDPPEAIVVGAGVAAIFAIVALVFVGAPIQQATGYDGSWMIFVTWFWLPFCLMPLVGTVVGLYRAISLYRGKFAASAITTNNVSTVSYDAVELRAGEGRPASFLFLGLAIVNLLVTNHSVDIVELFKEAL